MWKGEALEWGMYQDVPRYLCGWWFCHFSGHSGWWAAAHPKATEAEGCRAGPPRAVAGSARGQILIRIIWEKWMIFGFHICRNHTNLYDLTHSHLVEHESDVAEAWPEPEHGLQGGYSDPKMLFWTVEADQESLDKLVKIGILPASC